MAVVDEVQFPTDISKGSSGGPERRTSIVELGNGFEERNTSWADSRHHYDAGLGIRSMDNISVVLAFFEARMGRLYGFRWKDWADYKSNLPTVTNTSTDQEIGVGDGATAVFQITKSYTSGIRTYVRKITKPVGGTVLAAIDGVDQTDGVDFTVNTATGEIAFNVAPPIGDSVTVGFEFDVPVRFDSDMIDVNHDAFRAGSIPNIEIVEVKV